MADSLESIGKEYSDFNPSADDGILRIVQNWGNELIAQMQNRLRANKTNASSSLSQSIEPQIKQASADNIRLTILMEDYWQYVEEGRRAGKMPPIKNIYEWIRNKRPIQQKIAQSPDRIAATKSLAYVIARKIGQKGTKAQPFVTPSLKQVTTQTLAQRIGRYIADTLGSP
jgi:hypothetical protein